MSMTDERETLTMEQQANRLRESLREQIARIDRLRELRDRATMQRSGLEVMLDEAYETAELELQERPYGIDTRIVVNIDLYGGGPAGGVEFETERTEHGLDWLSARCWHNDWFQSKGWSVLDNDTAQSLWDTWGLEYAMGDA